MKHLKTLLLLSLLLIVATPTFSEEEEPLIMENADIFRGFGTSGKYHLEGGIKFKRGKARFYTEKATWDSGKDELLCTGGFKFTHPKGRLTAEQGYYKKAEDRVHAEGNIVARDSASSLFMYADELDYFQKERLTRLKKGNPRIKRVIENEAGGADTLEIAARLFEFNDSLRIATATTLVKVTKGTMVIRCDTSVYNMKEGILTLTGNPIAQIEGFEIHGKKMRITMSEDTIKTLEVIAEARGNKKESTGDGSTEISELEGDSLFVEFNGNTISNLEVVGSAQSRNYRMDRKEYVNEMKGNSLKMIMQDGQLDTIKIWKQASTLYHYFNSQGAFEGKNDAVGDTIWLEFKDKAISGFSLKGNVSQGVYSGEKKTESESKANMMQRVKSIIEKKKLDK